LLHILGPLEVIDVVFSCLSFEEIIVQLDYPVLVLVLDVLDNEVHRLKSLLTYFADILFAFDHFFGLIQAVLILHFNENLVFLRVGWLFIKRFLEDLVGLGDVVLLEEPCRAVES